MPYKDINRNRKNILIAFVNILIALAYAIRIFTSLLIVFLSILYKVDARSTKEASLTNF
jgi:hypothetical protein